MLHVDFVFMTTISLDGMAVAVTHAVQCSVFSLGTIRKNNAVTNEKRNVNTHP